MTTLMTTVEKWEDRYLDQLKQVEEPMLQFARSLHFDVSYDADADLMHLSRELAA